MTTLAVVIARSGGGSTHPAVFLIIPVIPERVAPRTPPRALTTAASRAVCSGRPTGLRGLGGGAEGRAQKCARAPERKHGPRAWLGPPQPLLKLLPVPQKFRGRPGRCVPSHGLSPCKHDVARCHEGVHETLERSVRTRDEEVALPTACVEGTAKATGQRRSLRPLWAGSGGGLRSERCLPLSHRLLPSAPHPGAAPGGEFPEMNAP